MPREVEAEREFFLRQLLAQCPVGYVFQFGLPLFAERFGVVK